MAWETHLDPQQQQLSIIGELTIFSVPSELLPAPLLPMMPNTSPGWMVRSMPLSASTGPCGPW